MDIRICIDVDDLERGIRFYTDGLGLTLARRLGDDWAELLGGSSPIDLLYNAAGTAPLGDARAARRDYARHWTPVHLDFTVPDVDAAVERLLRAGATLERPATDRTWGRIAGLADPFGHGLDVIEFRGRGYDALLHPASQPLS